MTLEIGTHAIESERLVLRRITADDLEFFARIHADPEVARYIAHGRPRTSAETRTWLDAILTAYSSLSLGQLAVRRKVDGVLLGRCGITELSMEAASATGLPRCWWLREQVPAEVPVTRKHELGYTFDRDQWGHGYATEAVRAVLRYVRALPPAAPLISVIHPQNLRSERLAAACGARREGSVEFFNQIFDVFGWPAVAPTPSA